MWFLGCIEGRDVDNDTMAHCGGGPFIIFNLPWCFSHAAQTPTAMATTTTARFHQSGDALRRHGSCLFILNS